MNRTIAHQLFIVTVPMTLFVAPLHAQPKKLSRQEQRIVNWVDQHIEDAYALLGQLVDTPSATMNVAGVREAGAILDEQFKAIGFETTLVEERPLLPASEIKSLVFKDGKFAGGYRELFVRYTLGRIDLDEVEAELRTQAARLRDLGVTLLHANGHQHLHVLPGILERVLRVAGEFGIRYVRIPDDAARRSLGMRELQVSALSRFARAASRLAKLQGFETNDRTIGIRDAGHLDADRIVELLDHVEEVTELVAHPGIGGGLAESYGWHYEWQREADALCDPASPRGVRAARHRDRPDPRLARCRILAARLKARGVA